MDILVVFRLIKRTLSELKAGKDKENFKLYCQQHTERKFTLDQLMANAQTFLKNIFCKDCFVDEVI